MPISSYVIRYRPNQETRVLRKLSGFPEISVGRPQNGGIPVVADTASTEEAQRLGDMLEKAPGVTSATLVYYNFEDLESVQQQIEPEKN